MTHGPLDMPNLSHEIIVMIINAGQTCTVNYSECAIQIVPTLKKVQHIQKPTSIKYDILQITFCFIQ